MKLPEARILVRNYQRATSSPSDRSVAEQTPRPPPAALDGGERGPAPARGQGLSGSHDDEANAGGRWTWDFPWDMTGAGTCHKAMFLAVFLDFFGGKERNHDGK